MNAPTSICTATLCWHQEEVITLQVFEQSWVSCVCMTITVLKCHSSLPDAAASMLCQNMTCDAGNSQTSNAVHKQPRCHVYDDHLKAVASAHCVEYYACDHPTCLNQRSGLLTLTSSSQSGKVKIMLFWVSRRSGICICM